MKTLKFSKKSWHFYLAHKANPHLRYRNIDICSYVRNVFFGFVIAVFNVALGFCGVALYLLFGALMSISFGLVDANSTTTGTIAAILLTPIALAGLIGGSLFLIFWIANKFENREKHYKPDGFLKNAYKSIKDKYCQKINFE